jgi:hypothetical protein
MKRSRNGKIDAPDFFDKNRREKRRIEKKEKNKIRKNGND